MLSSEGVSYGPAPVKKAGSPINGDDYMADTGAQSYNPKLETVMSIAFPFVVHLVFQYGSSSGPTVHTATSVETQFPFPSTVCCPFEFPLLVAIT